jgi:hypothetical protein
MNSKASLEVVMPIHTKREQDALTLLLSVGSGIVLVLPQPYFPVT